MNTFSDPWSYPTPTGNREDIWDRGTVSADAYRTETEQES